MEYSIAAIVSMASLGIVALLCILAALAHAVRDNLIERIGFAVLCFGCLARMFEALDTGDVLFGALALHVGIALVFVGGALAKWRICK